MLKNIEMTLAGIEAKGEKPDLSCARESLISALAMLDNLVVQGRENIDKLLGCMMAIEQIIGEEGDNGG